MTNTKKLAQAIEKSGLSLMALSQQTRIPYGHIIKLVSGDALFKSKEIDKFCDALKLPVEARKPIFF